MKIINWPFAFVAVLATVSLSAMYQSNPQTPEMIDEGFVLPGDYYIGLKAGYQFDQVFNRRMGVTNISGQVDDAKIFANRGVLTLNFMDRVEVWGSGGAAIFHFSNEINHPSGMSGPAQKIDYKTQNSWIWGVGGRAAFVSWGDATLGASAGYQSAHPKVHWNTVDGTPFSHSTRFRYSEWQVGLGVSYKVGIFIPYIGGTFSRAKAALQHIPLGTTFDSPPGQQVKMENQQHYGITIGCDVSTGKIFDLGIEFRMITENAITVKGDLKF